MNNYIEEYYNKIQTQEIIVGKWIRLIYEKLINGIESGNYIFVEDESEKAVEWIEKHCFHTEGPLAPNPLKLELWQKAIISAIFGVYDANGEKRQFREVMLVVSRKNGKTLFGSAIVKYMLSERGGYGARIYCTAPRLEQASLVYDSVWQQVQLDPDWQEEENAIRDSIQGHNRKSYDDSLHIRKRASDIFIPGLNASFKKQSFSEKKSDGFNPSLVICDEIASWQGDKGLKQYEVYKSGCAAREMGDNPSIILSCTTSGYINDSIYDENVKRSTRFLLGESKETKLLPFLYMIDDIEKWNDMNELRKSNPNMDISVSEDYLKEEISIAEGSMSKKAEFITKYCCMKQNSSLAWLEANVIENACGAPLNLEEFRGCYCVGGIDLSQTTDLTACNVVIEKSGQLYVFSKFFLPAEKIQEATERDGVPYNIYIEKGFLQASGDNFVDYKDCLKWFTDLVSQYELYPLQVGYDRYSAQYLVQEMEQFGFHMDDVYQGDNLWPVIQEFEGLMKNGQVHIGNNDLLKIHLLNSAIKMSVERGRGRLVKINATDHIDGCAALLDAFCVRQKHYKEIGMMLANEDS